MHYYFNGKWYPLLSSTNLSDTQNITAAKPVLSYGNWRGYQHKCENYVQDGYTVGIHNLS